MPSHKSCAKRMRTSANDRLRNRAVLSQMRSAVKELRAETSKDEALRKLRDVFSILDKAASRNVIHWRNAGRTKSRLTRFVQNIA